MLIEEDLDEQELFVSTMFLIVHLSVFNLVRQERFVLEQEESKKPKIGRNDPCPCGSGKKYKKCCMNK